MKAYFLLTVSRTALITALAYHPENAVFQAIAGHMAKKGGAA